MPVTGHRAALALALTLGLPLALAGTWATASAAPGPDYLVRPGANQVAVLGAGADDALTLTGPGGTQNATADAKGSFLWRQLAAGSYTVTDGAKQTTVAV